jgi:hypothetical protein
LHTSAHSPEQNDTCERFNRTLTEALRTVLLTSRMARTFWGELIMSSTYVGMGLRFVKTQHFLYQNVRLDEAHLLSGAFNY